MALAARKCIFVVVLLLNFNLSIIGKSALANIIKLLDALCLLLIVINYLFVRWAKLNSVSGVAIRTTFFHRSHLPLTIDLNKYLPPLTSSTSLHQRSTFPSSQRKELSIHMALISMAGSELEEGLKRNAQSIIPLW